MSRRTRSGLASGLAALALLTATPALAQETALPEGASEATPLPPERPAALQPTPEPPRPPADRDEAVEEPAAPSDEPATEADEPAPDLDDAPGPPRPPTDRDARTDESSGPPPRPATEEIEAVLPDEAPAPLEITPADREAHAACLADLDGLGVAYEEPEPIDGEGGCGVGLPVRVAALPAGDDGDAISLEPAVTVTCPVARGLARWTAEAVVPAAREHLEARVETLYVAGSYVCRGRNRDPEARLSEHAIGNAVDVTGIGFAEEDGEEEVEAWAVEPRAGRRTPRARFQREIRRQACAHFATVLGPGSDAYHDDHLHLDQRERENDYRLCE